MRALLWSAVIGGIGCAVLGVLHYLSLQPAIARTPAIVIVPQMIQAVLVSGFGVLAATVGAAGLALLEAASRHQATLDRIARHTEPPPAPAPQINRPAPSAPSAAPPQPSAAPAEPPRPAARKHTPFGMRACPSCGEMNWHDARACTKCQATLALAPLPKDPAAP